MDFDTIDANDQHDHVLLEEPMEIGSVPSTEPLTKEEMTKKLFSLTKEELVSKIIFEQNRADFAEEREAHLLEEIEKWKKAASKLFNPDSIELLRGDKAQQNHWSDATVEKALPIRYVCGYSGYQLLLEMGWPYPSARTLNRKIECMPFQPGLIDENFAILEKMVKTMKPMETNAILTIDECALQGKVEIDPSTGGIIGLATIPRSKSKRAKSSGNCLF